MHTLTKLVSDTWLTFNPQTSILSIELLALSADYDCSYVLDLSDETDNEEFIGIFDYLYETSTNVPVIENTSSSLTFSVIPHNRLLTLLYNQGPEHQSITADILANNHKEELKEFFKRILSIIEE